MGQGDLDEGRSINSAGADASELSSRNDPERLSTIHEEAGDWSDPTLMSDFAALPRAEALQPHMVPIECDSEWWLALEAESQPLIDQLSSAAYVTLDEMVDADTQPQASKQVPTDNRVTAIVGLHYVSFAADPSVLNAVEEIDDQGNYFVEMLFSDSAAKLILDCPPPDGYCARLRVYVANLKKAVVDRDTDLLTSDEYRNFAREVAAAILEELMVWIGHECFTRRPRRGARNILDVKWVGKWKRTKSKEDPSKMVQIICMRMTLRGIKDVDADSLKSPPKT